MFGPWIEVYVWFKELLPNFSRPKGIKGIRGLRLPRASFILLHYAYLITLTIIGSVILFPGGNLAYIDALFFGSGAATQSGLNTVNLNEMFLYQQITLMLLTMFATPIFINTCVVFIRLYWFETRFQNVVLEAQRYRRTRERSRTRTESKGKQDIVSEEKGVGRRKIVVMHPGERTMEIAENPRILNDGLDDRDDYGKGENSSGSSSKQGTDDHESSSTDYAQEGDGAGHETANGKERDTPESGEHKNFMEASATFRRDITFADEVNPLAPANFDGNDRTVVPQSKEHSIAFIEKQRNPKDTGALYIPGPRDFDRGYRPQEVDENEEEVILAKSNASNVETTMAKRTPSILSDDGDEPSKETPLRKKIGNNISFEDPALPIPKKSQGVFSKFRFPQRGLDDADDKGDEEREDPDTPASLRKRGRARTFASFRTALTHDDEANPMPYLSYEPTIGRNSAFVDLNEQQREELGGIEYRALKTLAITLCSYYVGMHLLGITCLAPWIVFTDRWGEKVANDGVSRAWWGIFTPASLFNDLGYTLTPDSMISFKYAVFPLLFGSWLVIIGNTGFPCWLRLMIWVLSKFVPKNSSLWEEFRFLLDHPRRCFTLLFPSKATWWLFWVLVVLNCLDLIFFCVLDLNDGVVSKLPVGIRVLDGWFQAASVRTAGFAVVNLSLLHPGCQVSYLIMMYISVFPIAISVRRTNVYEEKSLGIWGSDPDDEDSPRNSYVGAHLRRQLSFDLWYIFLGLFIICIVEGDKITNNNDFDFTIFSVLFEIVSAYGTVGLSLGYPGTNTSFSAQFRTISKLVIIAMQIRGRHRGLPYALDKAILLPSEEHAKKENEGTRRHRPAMAESNEEEHNLPTLPRVSTGLSTRSNMSNKSQRKGGWKRLLSSALSAGPSGKRMD